MANPSDMMYKNSISSDEDTEDETEVETEVETETEDYDDLDKADEKDFIFDPLDEKEKDLRKKKIIDKILNPIQIEGVEDKLYVYENNPKFLIGAYVSNYIKPELQREAPRKDLPSFTGIQNIEKLREMNLHTLNETEEKTKNKRDFYGLFNTKTKELEEEILKDVYNYSISKVLNPQWIVDSVKKCHFLFVLYYLLPNGKLRLLGILTIFVIYGDKTSCGEDKNCLEISTLSISEKAKDIIKTRIKDYIEDNEYNPEKIKDLEYDDSIFKNAGSALVDFTKKFANFYNFNLTTLSPIESAVGFYVKSGFSKTKIEGGNVKIMTRSPSLKQEKSPHKRKLERKEDDYEDDEDSSPSKRPKRLWSSKKGKNIQIPSQTGTLRGKAYWEAKRSSKITEGNEEDAEGEDEEDEVEEDEVEEEDKGNKSDFGASKQGSLISYLKSLEIHA